MRIALVILHADPARGGAERYTIDLAAALAERGHDVALVATSFADVPAAVRQVHIDAARGSRLQRYRAFLDGLERHLAGTSYDVVHAMLPVRSCDVYHPHAGLAAEAVATGHTKYSPGIRRVLAAGANRLNQKRRLFAKVERDLLERDDAPVVLCLSEYVKGSVRKHYDLPERKLATLFNAVDLRKFDPARDIETGTGVRRRLGIWSDRVVALVVAQDFERKGLREAIQALARVGSQSLTLVVVGKGKTGPYERLARQEGVADRVIFAGPTSDVYSFYQAADLFVLPTRHDPCSLVVLESLAMGVPVISTVYNGACEIMTDGLHGRVLNDPGDVPALATAMRHLLDEQTRRAASEACLALRPRLSYEAHVETLMRVYQGIVPHSGQRSGEARRS